MRVGIRFSSTSPTSHGEPTARTTWRLYACKFTRIAASVACTFRTACTPKKSCHRSSSSSFRSRSSRKGKKKQYDLLLSLFFCCFPFLFCLVSISPYFFKPRCSLQIKGWFLILYIHLFWCTGIDSLTKSGFLQSSSIFFLTKTKQSHTFMSNQTREFLHMLQCRPRRSVIKEKPHGYIK